MPYKYTHIYICACCVVAAGLFCAIRGEGIEANPNAKQVQKRLTTCDACALRAGSTSPTSDRYGSKRKDPKFIPQNSRPRRGEPARERKNGAERPVCDDFLDHFLDRPHPLMCTYCKKEWRGRERWWWSFT